MTAKSKASNPVSATDTAKAEAEDARAFDEASGGALTKATPSATPVPAGGDMALPKESGGGWLAFLGGAFGILWLGGAAAYLAGYADLTSLTPAQLGGLSVFAVAPSMLFFLAGLLGREVARAGARSRRLDAAVARLAAPVGHAEADAERLADAVSLQVDRVNQAMQGALARLAAIEEVITHHADSLEDSSGRAKAKADGLVKSLREERSRLSEVAEGLDDKAALIAAAIQDQSKMVAAAAELAEAKAADGEKLIRSGADRLAAAGKAAEEAGDRVALSLDARATELRDFSERLRERTEGLEAAYLKHRDRLGEAAETLRKEQEKIGAALDFHKAELETMSRTARDGAESLKGAAETSGAVFERAVEDALSRASGLAKEINSQSEAAAKAQEMALTRLQDAAAAARQAAEDAGGSLTRQASDAEAALERVSEAGFEAARRSDEAFQARLREAEDLTAKAAKAAEDASDSVRRQLADTLKSANEESRRIEDQLNTLRLKMEGAPDIARTSVETMERVMQEGLEMLNRSAEEASQQARDIDAQFQARIRQNYELLSDFILRMGGVAGGRKPIDLGVNELPDPLPRRRDSRVTQDERPEAALARETQGRSDQKGAKADPKAVKADPSTDARAIDDEALDLGAQNQHDDQPAGRSKDRGGGRTADRSHDDGSAPGDDAPSRRGKSKARARDAQDDRPRREGGWRWRDLLATMDPDQDKDADAKTDEGKDGSKDSGKDRD
jgi:hypothetical protein